MGIGLQKKKVKSVDSSEKMALSNFNTILSPLGPFNCLAVLYFPFGLSPNNWTLTM